MYNFGPQVIRIIAPCPSRSELEFQLHNFLQYRNSQEKSASQDTDTIMKNLTGSHITPDNPELVAVVRNHFVDLPRPYVTKFSLPLTRTPQAEVVDKILKEKVCIVLHCCHCCLPCCYVVLNVHHFA